MLQFIKVGMLMKFIRGGGSSRATEITTAITRVFTCTEPPNFLIQISTIDIHLSVVTCHFPFSNYTARVLSDVLEIFLWKSCWFT